MAHESPTEGGACVIPNCGQPFLVNFRREWEKKAMSDSSLPPFVTNKLAEAIDLWAQEYLSGKPAVLIYATYFSLVKCLEEKTAEIEKLFGDN